MKIIAHRGASSRCPENTLASVQAALKTEVDFVEIDVRLSKEGIPVIIHDATVGRVTRYRKLYSICNMTLDQIKKIDVGSWFGCSFSNTQIPTLEEILNLNWNKKGLMLEIKHCKQSPETVVKALIQTLNDIRKPLPRMILASFCIDTINEVQKHLHHFPPGTKIMGLIEKQKMVAPFITSEVAYVGIWYRLVKPALVQLFTAQNIDVWVFTVDDPTAIPKLRDMGVKGIISNIADSL